MSHYVMKLYGLVCDVCEFSEEHVPTIDEPRKLADTRAEFAKRGWTRNAGKDICTKGDAAHADARLLPTVCRSRSRYGACGRTRHDGPHAVPIGDGVWFGYIRDGRRVTRLGFGHLHGDTFTPDCTCRRPEGAGADHPLTDEAPR